MTRKKVGDRLKREWYNRYYETKSATYWQGFRGSRILIHHGVVPTKATAFNSRFVTQRYLEKQIVFFKRHFHLASMEELLKGEYSMDRYTVALTFDDGYKNNFDLVLPLLEKYKVPACFFVTSILSEGQDILWADHLDLGYHFTKEQINIAGRDYYKSGGEFRDRVTGISLKQHCKEEGTAFKKEMMRVVSDQFRNKGKLSVYWQLMSDMELEKLSSSPYASIGSHGHFHNNYASIEAAELTEDLKRSKAHIQNVTQQSVEMLAFPDGSYTREVVDVAEKTGFKHQFSTGHLFEEDMSDIRLNERLGINPYIRMKYQAKAMIDGYY